MGQMSDPLAAYRAGSLEPWTVDVLCSLVVAMQARVVLETGSFEGMTTMALFNAMKRSGVSGKLITIESDHERCQKVMELFEGNQPLDGPIVQVSILEKDALDALRHLHDEAIDFLFLDDDHSAPHVAEEIREAYRVLRPGGICCVHDVIGPFGLGAIVRAAGGFILPFERMHHAGGLGVLTK